MGEKIKLAILFGGQSAEHEVSLQSAKSIIEALDKEKYEILPIAIDKQGVWQLYAGIDRLWQLENANFIALNPQQGCEPVALVPGRPYLCRLAQPEQKQRVDVVLPVVHGPLGEDGTIQGLLELAHLPYVGAGVLGSAIGMDKDVMKRLLRDGQIPVSRFKVFRRFERHLLNFSELSAELGSPLFIKPANMGSSVGVSKVAEEQAFDEAVSLAFQFDEKILVEQAIVGRELEVAVLGNDNPQVSLAGEILPRGDFYSYEAKYIDENGAGLKIPADLPAHVLGKIQSLAKQSFLSLCCEGMARIDLFLSPDEKIYINEINTIPGFTKISMYPKLWQVSGLPYGALLDRLIELAFEKQTRKGQLKTSYL